MSSPPNKTGSVGKSTAYDPEIQFVLSLRDLGWDDMDFAMFVSPECEQLRSFVLNNLKSRGK